MTCHACLRDIETERCCFRVSRQLPEAARCCLIYIDTHVAALPPPSSLLCLRHGRVPPPPPSSSLLLSFLLLPSASRHVCPRRAVRGRCRQVVAGRRRVQAGAARAAPMARLHALSITVTGLFKPQQQRRSMTYV